MLLSREWDALRQPAIPAIALALASLPYAIFVITDEKNVPLHTDRRNSAC